MSNNATLETVYDPTAVEPEIYALWEQAGAFVSKPDGRPHDTTYTIVIPPPNVTGALHLGHALNNTLQDILIRYHRMRGFNTLWQPGTDHAGIATQAVVERRIREQEGKTRHELGREELVRRIWQWKDEYEARILNQLKLMGCSCDWSRNRFTLDEGLARAVRHMFFMLFRDGLIFRGKRLVNWDTQLQTAVADDEVYYDTVKGHFWHFKYPVISEQSRDREGAENDPEHVIIATTRPETMLGDTAVAVHPDPAAYFDKAERELKEMWDRLSSRSSREAKELKARLDALAERRETHLPLLITLRDMARAGRQVMLPLVERPIPLICDEWADPTLGTGCVKITPAHDPNDYEVALRHDLPMINVLTPDGKVARIVEPDGNINPNSERYEGLTFASEDRETEIGHSDRSKLPIEPYLSDQWFVRTSDVGGVEGSRDQGIEEGTKGRRDEGTKSSRSPELRSEISNLKSKKGLAQPAMDAVNSGRIQVFPPRYAKSYLDWLAEKRDWCISRQLWWGHRIPIWTLRCTYHDWLDRSGNDVGGAFLLGDTSQGSVCVRAESPIGESFVVAGVPRAYENLSKLRDAVVNGRIAKTDRMTWFVGVEDEFFQAFDQRKRDQVAFENALSKMGFTQDPDVLDTWFSSALWPFSTLGWPDETEHLRQYYPTTVLCTSRDIITNWVARMVMFGLYAMGEVPFDHVYIHPKILDGRGETMSKSKGNGVDPVDVIHTHGADALRYAMADMCTETQDIRMPVEYVCPHCGQLTDQTAALAAEEQSRKSRGLKLDRGLQPADIARVKCRNKDCGREFATQWADQTAKDDLGIGRETSDKFDIGRNFCNKLWNAARFAFMNLKSEPQASARASTQTSWTPEQADLLPEDCWILACLSQTVRRYHECLANYQFSASVKELRDFFWDSLCDWYVELTKPRFTATAETKSTAQEVLAFCLDQTLRLFHPTIPFITERLWQQLNAIVPNRCIPTGAALACKDPLILAEFPPVVGYPDFDDERILATFAQLQDATRAVRDLRSQCGVSPKDKVTVTAVVPSGHAGEFQSHAHIVQHMANIDALHVTESARRPPNAASMALHGLRIYVHDISDDDAERTRTSKALEAVGKQIAGKESKLSNEKFLQNAKPEIVQAERDRLDDLRAQHAALSDHLAELENSA